MKVPHAWDGSAWTCTQCHETHPDPCSCRCCGLQCATSDPQTAVMLRSYGDMLRARYGLLEDRAYLAQAQPRRVRQPASAEADLPPRPRE